MSQQPKWDGQRAVHRVEKASVLAACLPNFLSHPCPALPSAAAGSKDFELKRVEPRENQAKLSVRGCLLSQHVFLKLPQPQV